MDVIETELSGVRVVVPRAYADARGSFHEAFREDRYAAAGLETRFVQDNVSVSRRGVLRGLHLQHPASQGKLVYVLRGAVYDVAVDVRVGSPTFGRWVARVLSDDNRHQLYVPPGFAHGFAVTSDEAVVAYKCTGYYDPGAEVTVRWDDAALAIAWPVDRPILSAKDACAPALADIPPHQLPAA